MSQFVKDPTDGDYKHLSLNGGENYTEFSALTYPQFFLNDSDNLFMYMRKGGNNNGAYKFSKYTASTSGVGEDKEWEFVKAGKFYNIDSKTNRGILRATGTGAIINTSFGAPREDSDKQWTVIYNDDGTYRFKMRNATRYLYNETDNTIVTSESLDNRSK